MNGFPKVLNTKQDYLNCLTDYPEDTKCALQALLDERYAWENKGQIEVGDMPVEDDTHRVVEDEDGNRIQFELVEDANSKIFRIGFTVAEVEELIRGI